MKSLIINRKQWLRGDFNSYLLRKSDKKKCCLGFLANLCGFSDEQIAGLPGPHLLMKDFEWSNNLFDKLGGLSMLCLDIIHVNDSLNLSDTQKEFLLKEQFIKMDINLEFVDD